MKAVEVLGTKVPVGADSATVKSTILLVAAVAIGTVIFVVGQSVGNRVAKPVMQQTDSAVSRIPGL